MNDTTATVIDFQTDFVDESYASLVSATRLARAAD
ncbi:MAG: hypothetical protein JWR33_466 [Naasia sp.]|nr:hypothetical protein [Naasia sp.]